MTCGEYAIASLYNLYATGKKIAGDFPSLHEEKIC